jgi:hypothetical protein
MNKLIAVFVSTLFAGTAFAQALPTMTSTAPSAKAEARADAKVDKADAKA